MIGTYCGETEFHGTIYSPVNGSLYLVFETDEGDQFAGFQGEVRVVGKCLFPIIIFLVEFDRIWVTQGGNFPVV